MNFFDGAVISIFNRLARASYTFDCAVYVLSDSHLFKGTVLAAAIWWVWFSVGEDQDAPRASVISTILGCVTATAFARVLVNVLPHRLRPVVDEGIGFVSPYVPDWVQDIDSGQASSFPSDHAVFCFAISVGLYFTRRKLGYLLLVYSAIFICLPRVYLGLHYATDILAGAAIGALFAWAFSTSYVRERFSSRIAALAKTRPAEFYTVFFLVTYQLAEMYLSARTLGGAALRYLKWLFSGG